MYLAILYCTGEIKFSKIMLDGCSEDCYFVSRHISWWRIREYFANNLQHYNTNKHMEENIRRKTLIISVRYSHPNRVAFSKILIRRLFVRICTLCTFEYVFWRRRKEVRIKCLPFLKWTFTKHHTLLLSIFLKIRTKFVNSELEHHPSNIDLGNVFIWRR